mmetsp:Transcript_28061/g.59843  ORF Transcript_28061/g.59843 Transcript_28061/m.59843 type:complete len:466 (+) Transcript_28061:3-1400(+)
MQPRPPSPVAKTLDEQQKQATEKSDPKLPPGGSNGNGSAIPNLLSSGKFPPPSHSPKPKSRQQYNTMLSVSPPTILSSPSINYNQGLMSSPPLPAAPPSTPYTPYNAAADAVPSSVTGSSHSDPAHLHPPLPLTFQNNNILNHRPSSPPLPMPQNSQSTSPSLLVPNIRPISPSAVTTAESSHYNTLLNTALHETAQNEKTRIATLTAHETQNYTSITEYQHALSRERRHSTSLALELAHYKFQTRYTSCNVHSAAEISEEARVNFLIKNINVMKKDMKEDKCRTVMELEREEERIINGLVGRLEELKREKMLLECQIGSSRGAAVGHVGAGGMGGRMDGDEARLHAQFERMMMANDSPVTTTRAGSAIGAGHQQQQQHFMSNNASRHHLGEAAVATAASAAMIGSESSMEKAEIENIKMEENSEEEEDEEEEGEDNNDILEGQYHDPEMEEELANLLKMKDSKE